MNLQTLSFTCSALLMLSIAHAQYDSIKLETGNLTLAPQFAQHITISKSTFSIGYRAYYGMDVKAEL